MRFAFLALSALVAAGPVASACAQGEAKHPLRILVPLPAGATSDVVARVIADELRARGGRPVIVENRPGASGLIAVEALKHAGAGGSTLLLAPIAVPVIAPLVFKDPGYDPARDLAPVAQVAKYQFALAVGADHPARTLQELVAWAKAHPARATYGTPGAGGLPHFLGALLADAAGIALVHVTYKGIAPVEADLMGGQIAAGISALSDFAALHRVGKLRILATAGARRSPALPEVPTFREQGFGSVEAEGWHGVFALAGTPWPVIERWSTAIVAILGAPEVREKLAKLGLEPTGTTPLALEAIMAADTARWAPIIKASGFVAER
jgi:tripartite-type tricarboxylate transporter receptor subunit TctC